jgi:hypothetical protein
MADGRMREAWNRTSTVLALIANVNRDPKKSKAFGPKDFHPYEARKAKPPVKADISIFKQFVSGTTHGKRRGNPGR